MKQRIISLMIAVMMVVMMLPVDALAAPGVEAGHNHTSGYCYVCSEGDPALAVLPEEMFDEGAPAVAYVGETGYPSLRAAIEAAASGDTVELTADITLTGTIVIDKELTLSGAGAYAVYRGFSGDALFQIANGGRVTLQGITIDGESDYYSGYSLFNVLEGATLAVRSGVRLEDNSAEYGGAIYVKNGGTLEVASGLITGCSATNSGGGIYNSGTVYLYGDGNITSNTASWGGGIWSDGTVHAEGYASVSGNHDFTNGDDNIHAENASVFHADADLYGAIGINLHEGWNGSDQVTGSAAYAIAGAENITSDWDSSFYGVVQDDNSLLLTAGVPQTTEVTVSFSGNAEDAYNIPAPVTVESGSYLPEIAAPSRDGFTFTGWMTYEGYSFDPVYTAVTEEMTLYAVWEENVPETVFCTVSFNANADDVYYIPESITVESGYTVSDPGSLEREGYRFTGWQTGDGTVFDFVNTPVTSDLVLYAGWEEVIPETVYYTVSFDANGIEAYNMPESFQAEAGTLIEEPAAPSNDAYKFLGWAGADGYYYDFASMPVSGDLVLYAQWTAVPYYTVAYDVQADDVSFVPNSEMVKEGGLATDPGVPYRPYYTFDGWHTEDGGLFDFANTPVSGDMILYAHWSEIPKVTITFDVQAEGVVVPQGQILSEGDYAMDPGYVNREGYTFDGWYTQDGELFDFANTQIFSDVIVYAHWTEIPTEPEPPTLATVWTVTFDPLYGEASWDVTVNDGATVSRPDPDPYYDDSHAFAGWFLEDGTLFDFNTPIYGDITISGHWIEVGPSHTVTFDPLNGEASWNVTVNDGATVSRPDPDPYYDDSHAFAGWYLEDGTLFDFNTPIYGDITISGHWTEVVSTHTVTFDPMNGEASLDVTVNDGDTVDKPEADPEYDDTHIFDNWYYMAWDGETVYDFNAPVTQDITIYAKWIEQKNVTVTFHANGYGTDPAPQTFAEGSYASQPVMPAESGVVFGGWYQEESCTTPFDFTQPVTENKDLYAKWSFTVVFHTEYGAAPANQIIGKGSTAADPGTLSTDGFTFDGWYVIDFAYKYDFSTPVTECLNLYAKWTQNPLPVNSYSVTFYAGHDIQISGQIVEEGKTVVKPADPSTPNYKFEGWYTEVTYTNAYDFNAPVTANLTLYAKWSEVQTPVQKYTVTFISERGTVPGAQSVESGQRAVKPNDPSSDGYLFGGWFTEQEYVNLYDFNTAVTGDITLYAKWTTRPVENHVVSFNANGHGNAPNPQTVQTGQLVQKPADPAAVGYTFSGWFTDTQCTQAFNFQAPVTYDQTLYARWIPNRYTVRFDANGGVGVMASQTYVYDTQAALPANAFTRTGFYFIGWNTAPDGSGPMLAEQAVIRNLTAVAGGTVNLYAQWRNIYNVIEGANGKIQKGGKAAITFKTDGDYNKFTGIRVDGYNVAATQYSSWAGSTYVQLKPEYVNQLALGAHTITFLYTDGSCETTFEVISATPTTGDTNNALLWVIIALVCLIIIVLIILLMLKKRRDYARYYDDDDRYDD